MSKPVVKHPPTVGDLTAQAVALINGEMERQGMKRVELAHLTFLSQKHVSLVLNGRVGSDDATLREMALAVGIRFVVTAEDTP